MRAQGRSRRVVGVLAVVAALGAPSTASAAEPALRAGAGRADITPPTGYALGGWVRADRTGQGVHTRLYASALVLQRGARKVALVATDLAISPGGLVKEVGERLKARGLTGGARGLTGGARGLDRRLDAPFVIVERESRGRWSRVDDDLGMNVVWTIDGAGNYTARWHVPSTTRNGTYRLVIWANRYRLTSQPFLVGRNVKPNEARAGDPIAAYIPFSAN